MSFSDLIREAAHRARHGPPDEPEEPPPQRRSGSGDGGHRGEPVEIRKSMDELIREYREELHDR